MYRSIVWLRRPQVMAIAAASLLVSLAVWQAAAAQQPRVARALVDRLESRFARATIGDWSTVTGLVIAGGNHHRIVEGMRLAREHRHLRVVLTGPSPQELALALAAHGVDRTRLTIEHQATNTFGNAVYSKAMISPRPVERWLLVTSASHMPRAIGSFWRVGFAVEPWPVANPWHNDRAVTKAAHHEWLGLLAYWARGRTTAVFPSHADLARIAPAAARPRT